MKIFDYPRRNGKILRNFDLLLPKFHFILPKFYFAPPWRVFICSVEISDFIREDWIEMLELLVSLGYLGMPYL